MRVLVLFVSRCRSLVRHLAAAACRTLAAARAGGAHACRQRCASARTLVSSGPPQSGERAILQLQAPRGKQTQARRQPYPDRAPQEAHLQAVPLWRVSLKHMGRALRHYRGRFNTVVAFRPNGWAHSVGDAMAPLPHRFYISFFIPFQTLRSGWTPLKNRYNCKPAGPVSGCTCMGSLAHAARAVLQCSKGPTASS